MIFRPSNPAHKPGIRQAFVLLQQRRWCWLTGAAGLALLALALDLSIGPVALGWRTWYGAFFNPGDLDAASKVIVWDIRLPQALLALSLGLMLGLAGAEMQTILANPLASPFTLGVASSAALGAALVLILGISLPGVAQSWAVAANAFLFAVLAALLLDVLARWGRLGTAGLVLFGIALVFSFNAALSLLQFVASAQALQNLVFWTMGSLSRASWPVLGIIFPALGICLAWALWASPKLTALRLGAEQALSLGINVTQLRLAALLRISLLAALAVAFAGTIGFVGLIAPHIARLIWGEQQGFYLAGSALVGAFIMSLAAVASKGLLSGVVLPIGIVTSLVGVPIFLLIIWQRAGNELRN